jgi:hypothetical protein
VSTLVDIQRTLQRSVVAHDAGAAGSLVDDGVRASARERIGVYVHAYPARLAEALRNDFIGVRALVGDERFDGLARAYIDAHPSTHANLRWFGAGFAAFLGDTVEAEMARLDWAIGLAFDARDEVPITLQAFAELDGDAWPELRFDLGRSLVRCTFEWNVGAFRRALDKGETPPACARFGSSQAWLVSRVDGTVYHRAADDDEAAALAVIANDGTFGEMCAALAAWHADDAIPPRALLMLKGWVASGWITRISATTSARD